MKEPKTFIILRVASRWNFVTINTITFYFNQIYFLFLLIYNLKYNYRNYFDPSAKRYIMSFTCTPTFLSPHGLEFITLKVKGQSFMLHQIRKMVGLLLAIVRGLCDEDVMERSFGEEKINLPKAPGLGLVLDTVHYDRYNNRFGSDGIHKVLTWTAQEEEIRTFIEKRIYSNIYDIELREWPMITWLLEHLRKHNFEVTKEQTNDIITATTELVVTSESKTEPMTMQNTDITIPSA